ncbi:hypothetical protein ONZ45_g18653 [Pleurotus djamor]|nr:hypothetical protein ONZ45_g18653 [Pleurotus djamor]
MPHSLQQSPHFRWPVDKVFQYLGQRRRQRKKTRPRSHRQSQIHCQIGPQTLQHLHHRHPRLHRQRLPRRFLHPHVSDTASPTTTTTPPPVSTPTTTTPPPTPTVIESAVVSSSTDAAGSAVEVTVTVPVTFTPSATSSTEPSSTSAASNGDSGGLGTGSIIGLSVAGGVAVIGIIAFIIWKVTRKRGFSDFDDSEAIKWPELNSHKDGGGDSVPLPTNNTGRSGFDTSTSPVVGGGLARTPSISSTAHTTRSTAPSAYSNVYNNSTPDLYHDPYAVPPLPHLNPNQPYRDDAASAAQAGYYDPYRGPVPSALHDPDGPPSATLAPNGQGWDHPNAGGEAIPMTQMAGRRSPGPGAGLGGYDAGRASPGPGMGRTMSPGPAMAYGGPGVGDPYGRRSPGPGQAYDVGRRSPGPYNAYGGP